MTQITDFIPQYQEYSYAFSRFVNAVSGEFEDFKAVTQFYNQHRDIKIFEKMMLDVALDENNPHKWFLFTTLKGDINRNVDLYYHHSAMLDNIEIECVNDNLEITFDSQIENQICTITTLGNSLVGLFNTMNLSGGDAHSDLTDSEMWELYEKDMTLYKSEIGKLNDLYQKQAECKAEATQYGKNIFCDMNSLNEAFLSIIERYLPADVQKEDKYDSALYFDMGTVSAIHKLCNNVQFEAISELDLYAILNLQSTSIKIVIKQKENIRVCYLIYKLYEMLQTPDKAKWRTEILAKAGISESYYGSKYKEPESDVPSIKSGQFIQGIKEILK